MYVCSCFGITEDEVRQHAASGRCTPRQIASHCKAGTDCGSCVKRIQALLGRGAGCATRDRLRPAEPEPAVRETAVAEPAAPPAPWRVTPSRPAEPGQPDVRPAAAEPDLRPEARPAAAEPPVLPQRGSEAA